MHQQTLFGGGHHALVLMNRVFDELSSHALLREHNFWDN